MDAASSSCCSMFIYEIFGRKKGSNTRIKQKRNQQTIKVCAVCMQYCILCIKPHTYQRRRIMWSALLSIEAWKKWSERENKYQSNRNIHNNNNINKRLGGTISDAQKNWKRKRRIHKNNKNKNKHTATQHHPAHRQMRLLMAFGGIDFVIIFYVLRWEYQPKSCLLSWHELW